MSKELSRHGCRPLYLAKQDSDGFYTGFSNGVLWPLFHGFADLSKYKRTEWRAYARVNELFADEIAGTIKPGDVVWIHDYQLSLVPELLRRRGVSNSVGFFLHIPFPSSEVYRTLPVREEILRGLLGADFIGFHAYEYVSHFRRACLRVLGLESEPESIRSGARRSHLGVLPIGIDPEEVRALTMMADAVNECASLEAAYRGKKLILGVDRLDYTKGIPEKLLAFEELLKNTSKWRERCVLVQVAAPSRETVDEYQSLKRRVDELVGRINGRFSTPRHTPIVYVNQNIPRSRLMGMYRAADVGLVTPVRDGMNLVALEYIAARAPRGARLILSEFAGAAYLLPGARLVNPYNIAEVAQALEQELEGGESDSSHMLEFVNENTSGRWANSFLERLEASSNQVTPRATRLAVDSSPVQARIGNPRAPLVLLDYDGTLRGYERKPSAAVPTRRLREVLIALSRHATVYVVSGRPAAVLEAWLGDLPIGLVAEHGFATRILGQARWSEMLTPRAGALRRVDVLFEDFLRRTPGAMVERKRSGIAWHYRSVEPEFATLQANELLHQLEDLLRKRPFDVLRGNRVIEVRHVECNKGHAAEALLKRHSDCDGIFCAGDDRTDEDMMDAVRRLRGSDPVLCWVGGRSPCADYWAESPEALLDELERLVQIWQGRNPAGSTRGAKTSADPAAKRRVLR